MENLTIGEILFPNSHTCNSWKLELQKIDNKQERRLKHLSICGKNKRIRKKNAKRFNEVRLKKCTLCRIRNEKVAFATLPYNEIRLVLENQESKKDKWIKNKFKEFYNSDNKIEYLVESGIMTKEVAENVIKAPSIRSFCVIFEEYAKLAYERKNKNVLHGKG